MAEELSAKETIRRLGLFLLSVADTTITLTLNLASGILHEMSVALLEARKNILGKIEAWLNNSYRGLKTLLIVLVAGAVVAGVAAVSAIIAAKISAATVIATIKTVSSGVSIQLMYGVAKGMWNLLVSVNEDVKRLETSFFEFADAFDETFGLPINTIANFAMGFRNYVTSLYAMTGLDPKLAHLDWLFNSTDWLKKVSDNFTEYAMHPGKFFDLLMGSIISMDEETASKLSLDQLEQLSTTIENVGNLSTNYDSLRDAVDEMIEAFPIEISDAITDQAGPYLTYIDTVVKPVLAQLKTTADNIGKVIDEAIETMKAPLLVDIDKIKLKIYDVLSWLGIELPNAYNYQNGMSELFSNQVLPSYLDWSVKDVLRDLTARFAIAPKQPVLITEPERAEVSLRSTLQIPIVSTVNNWYVKVGSQPYSVTPLWEIAR